MQVMQNGNLVLTLKFNLRDWQFQNFDQTFDTFEELICIYQKWEILIWISIEFLYLNLLFFVNQKNNE